MVFELRVSGFGFRVSGFRISVLVFRGSGFGSRVSGFGFRGLDVVPALRLRGSQENVRLIMREGVRDTERERQRERPREQASDIERGEGGRRGGFCVER